MELGKAGTAEREPIVFDFSTLPEDQQAVQGKNILFSAGYASFGNELYDAVAMGSEGIDDEGRLDMDALAAAEAAESYLRGRQGQPVVLADMIRDEDGNVLRVDALLGVLDQGDKLVGAFKGPGGWSYGGIKLEGDCHELTAFSFSGVPRAPVRLEPPVRLERVIIASGGAADFGLLPFDRVSVTLGHPEDPRPDRPNWEYTQELVAGEDIMQWVREQFGEEAAGYEMFTGLLMGVRTPKAQAYLLQKPFVTMLAQEQHRLEEISATLGRTRQKVELYDRARAGVLADASLALDALKEKAGPLARRLPYTGDRTSVVEEVNGVHDIAARQDVVTRSHTYLAGLVLPHPENE